MISSEKAQAFLDSKRIKDISDKREKAVRLLDAKQRHLGLLLIHRHPDFQSKNDETSWRTYEKRTIEIRMLLAAETAETSLWQSDYPDLLPALFGDFAPYIDAAWQNMTTLMYRTDYLRRSFRAPYSPALYRARKSDLLLSLTEELKYDFTLPEYARYAGYFSGYRQLKSHVFAAAIEKEDAVGQEVNRILIDTIYGKDEVGKICRAVIESLLLTQSTENHIVIEKLLLSAQRQEGLRQTILECLDETSLAAQKHLMQTVLDHDLLRFSSVVRALDVWCGMEWESAKAATVRRCMQLGLGFLKKPQTIDETLQSKDNLEIYMALWASGCVSIEKTLPRIEKVLARPEDEKKATALLFLSQIGIPREEDKIAQPFLSAENLLLATFAFHCLALAPENKAEIFQRLLELWHKIEGKTYTVKSKIFAWTHYELTRYAVMNKVFIYAEEADLEKLTALFPEMAINNRYSFVNRYLLAKKKPFTAAQRQFVFEALTDRSDSVRALAFKALEKTTLTPAEAEQTEDLLKRKSADLRRGILQLLAKQTEPELLQSTRRLLVAKNIQQRLAGLDLLLQLFKEKKQTEQVLELAAAYRQREKISDKEAIILSGIRPDKEEFTKENGYGLYNPQNLTPSPEPRDVLGYQEKSKEKTHPYSVDLPRLTRLFEELARLVYEYREYEYETEDWNGTKTKVLLGSSNSIFLKYNRVRNIEKNPRAELENLALSEVWESWYKAGDFTPEELWYTAYFAAQEYASGKKFDFIAAMKDFFRPQIVLQNNEVKRHILLHIIKALNAAYPFAGRIDAVLNILESLFAAVPDDLRNDKKIDRRTYYKSWRNADIFNFYRYYALDFRKMNRAQLSRFWHLKNWYDRTVGEVHNDWRPSLPLVLAAFKAKIINRDDLTERVLFGGYLNALTRKKSREKLKISDRPAAKEIIDKCVNRILDIELKRGDTATDFTKQATEIQSIFGIDRLIQILSALKKDKLHKGYIYSWYGENSKKMSFSHLLRVCYPRPEETFADFKKAVTAAKISEQRLLETAMYAPQWLEMIQEFIGWKKLTEAVWWFHAHTKESGYTADARWEADLSNFTSLQTAELTDGAVDVQWYKFVYASLKKARWEKLYAAAKYISTGPGYRRAQIFADALAGNFKTKNLIAEIVAKRNQDKVRALGLVPLNKRNPQADILKRYKVLQRFLKESKQFGSQRQVSEKTAVTIALDNLSRTANYPDPIRLSWAMEALEAREILEKSKPVTVGETQVKLYIDADGKAHLGVAKAGKKLKAIPAKLRKNKAILALKESQKVLREQHRRTRKALEEAMCRGDEFTATEIEKLLLHPVVAPQLRKLVFAFVEDGNTTVGYFDNGTLTVPGKETFVLPEAAVLRLAHCTDLYASGDWSALQSDVFQDKKVQPFKQIFREMYLPTHDELTEVTTSRRYAGHQVQAKKTVALLKTRGWTVEPDSGLKKVYHRENLVVNLYALADWFSPADVESPTLETVSFDNRTTGKLVPLKDISPLIFSEVMRDLDLVVSTAHAGGTDPEASHSTVEMRAVMATETADLLGFDNIKMQGSHVIINGELGDYSLHLGSGVVHKMPGGYLSILPVHSAHRGRIFLPFADDDLKTAEILSKLLLLAEDGKIKDPTVLRQL